MICISIHAPARGATCLCHIDSPYLRNFNPRSREGSDNIMIQIFLTYANFNPRSREGSDLHSAVSVSAADPHFNPRSREGSDSITRPIASTTSSFQSTLPRGERRKLRFVISKSIPISIHAPARGATSILSKIHPMFLTISHNASSFSSFPFHSFLPHLLNSSTFCALFQVRISRAFSVYYRFAPKKSTPDL